MDRSNTLVFLTLGLIFLFGFGVVTYTQFIYPNADRDTLVIDQKNITYVLIGLAVFALIVFMILQAWGKNSIEVGRPLLHRPHVLFALGGIIGTSMVMMWVEVIFTRYILLPQTHGNIISTARCQGARNKQIAADGNQSASPFLPIDLVEEFETQRDSALFAAQKTEEKKVKQINTYAYTTMLYGFLFLAFILFLIFIRLHHLAQIYPQERIMQWFHVRSILFGIISSIVLFGAFQVLFYYYALGAITVSPTQLEYAIQQKTRKDLKCDR